MRYDKVLHKETLQVYWCSDVQMERSGFATVRFARDLDRLHVAPVAGFVDRCPAAGVRRACVRALIEQQNLVQVLHAERTPQGPWPSEVS